MKKILPIIIVLVVLGGAGWFVFTGRGSEVTTGGGTGQEAAPEVPSGGEKSFTGKLKDALSLGTSMKCTWKQDENNFATSYVKGNKAYIEGTYSGIKSYSISVDNCMYVWQADKTEGFKICYEPEEMAGYGEAAQEMEGQGPTPSSYSGELPDVNYSCEPAVVSDAKFNPPSNVTFLNPEEMTPSQLMELQP